MREREDERKCTGKEGEREREKLENVEEKEEERKSIPLTKKKKKYQEELVEKKMEKVTFFGFFLHSMNSMTHHQIKVR